MYLKASVILIGSCLASVSDKEVKNVWDQAQSTIRDTEQTLGEVREHTEEAVRRESKDVEDSRRHLHESADELQKSAAAFREAESKLQEPVDPRTGTTESSFLQNTDSSFLEFPESLMQFPGVAEDMRKVKAAEEKFKEKMQKLHEKDDELMALAKKDFTEGRKAMNEIGHFRKNQPASFLEKKITSPIDRVVEAEMKLKEINDKLGKDFGFISF